MMGHRERLANGDERDFLTRARRHYGRPRRAKAIKRGFGKRVRRAGRAEAAERAGAGE